ncbi:hypothetical protein [Nocardia yunnanensis]|nr:hypothetical protein [Nocardia yunnanensis]
MNAVHTPTARRYRRRPVAPCYGGPRSAWAVLIVWIAALIAVGALLIAL